MGDERKSDEELRLELDNAAVLLGDFMTEWRHAKSGNTYYIVGVGYDEATLDVVVMYASPKTMLRWVRPISEFLDGRFTKLRDTVGD